MRLLVITDFIGIDASGIVIAKFLSELQKYNYLDVFTFKFDEREYHDLGNIHIVNLPAWFEKIRVDKRKMLIRRLGFNPFYEYGRIKIIGNLAKGYDAILGFCHGTGIFGLVCGVSLKKRLKIPLITYFFDAVPAPIGWIKDDRYRRNLARIVSRNLKYVDGLLSANKKMLQYELGFVPRNNQIKVTGCVYTPGQSSELLELPVSNEGKIIFCYTGSIYYCRKADYILDAFNKLVKVKPNCELWFVGTKNLEEKVNLLDSGTKSRIKIFPYTYDLIPYYSASSALIDIDADLPDDVYLSSKITNYIGINRPIISETGENSESRRIFADLKTVYQCGHDAEELFTAMKSVVEIKGNYDYSEREALIKTFSLEENTAKLSNFISSVISG